MDSVDEACGRRLRYEIPTIRPSYIRNHYDNDAIPVPMMPWNLAIKMLGLPTYNSVMRTDLSLIFDAILFDRSLYNPLFNMMAPLALMLPRAKKRGKKLACYNVGAGPVDSAAGRRILRELADMMDFITVRDEGSYRVLQDVGVSNDRVLLTADAALNVRPSSEERIRTIFESLALNPNEEILAVNVNRYLDTWAKPTRTSMGKDKFLKIYASALNQVVEKLNVPLLFVATQHHDVQISKELMGMLRTKQPVRLLANTAFNHYDIKGALSKVSLLLGMRLHSMILATAEHTPTVGIAYQPKCAYYFEDLGLSSYMLDFDDFSSASLTELFLRGWEDRVSLRRALETRVPALKARAHFSGELVAAIDRGEDVDRLIARARSDERVRQVGQ